MAKLQKFYDLDNAAKIFPAVANENRPYMFRMSVVFKESIDAKVMKEALEKTTKRFVNFNVRLRKGWFWHFFEENPNLPKLNKETGYINQYLVPAENQDFLFRAIYDQNRLSVEFFHALTDGTGALEFINSLAFTYLQLKGYDVNDEGKIRHSNSKPSFAEVDDEFQKIYDNKTYKVPKEQKAHHIKGTTYANGYHATIHSYFDVKEIKALVKSLDATITEFFTAAITYAYLKSDVLARHKYPFRLLIPVNVRKFYQSISLRNFVSFIRFNQNLDEKSVTFKDILLRVKLCFKEELSYEKLYARMMSNVKYEKNFFNRIAPLPLKILVMKSVYGMIGESMNTVTFSNIGVVDLPESMKPYISHYQFNIGPSPEQPKVISAITYNNVLSVAFISNIIERNIEKEFFKLMHEFGLTPTIEANEWEVLP